MSDSIDIVVADIERSERFQTMKQHIEMVLPSAYARAMKKPNEGIAQDLSSWNGLDLAASWLSCAGYIKPDDNGIYVATEKGVTFMENHYGGHTIGGVDIKTP